MLRHRLPVIYDISFSVGTTYGFILTLRSDGDVLDLTGWQAWAQIRSANSVLIADFQITINALSGQIECLLSATETNSLTPSKGLKWGLLVETDSGDRYELIVGNVTITPPVVIP